MNSISIGTTRIRIILLVYLGLGSFLFSGCGFNLPEARRAVTGKPAQSSQQQVFFDALMASPATEPISVETNNLDCDPQAIGQIVAPGRPFETSQTKVSTYWTACQMMYACSPSARHALREFERTGQNFRLSLVDFASIPGEGPVGQTLGVYVHETDRIFVQTAVLETPAQLMESCGYTLHELYHRFDSGTHMNARGESLEKEFPAYYVQYWFEAEIHNRGHWNGHEPQPFDSGAADYFPTRLLEPVLPGTNAVDRSLLTIESLARWIMKTYGLTVSETKIQNVTRHYRPFPWEI